MTMKEARSWTQPMLMEYEHDGDDHATSGDHSKGDQQWDQRGAALEAPQAAWAVPHLISPTASVAGPQPRQPPEV